MDIGSRDGVGIGVGLRGGESGSWGFWWMVGFGKSLTLRTNTHPRLMSDFSEMSLRM